MKAKNTRTLLMGVFVICWLGTSFAQEISPQSVNSCGVGYTQSNGSLSFTVGELVILTFVDEDGNTLGNGFTSSATGTEVLAVNAPEKDVLNIQVYPNPTSEKVFLEIISTRLDAIEIELIDINGRMLSQQKHTNLVHKISIPTANLEAGTYILILKETGGNTLGNYKIIKQ